MADLDFLVPGGALRGPLAQRLLSGETPAAEPPLPLGSRVGAFVLRDTLGRGGSGWVYRAERADGNFEQAVALKVLRGGGLSSIAMERERKVLASLRHPNIAMIIDGGTTGAGAPWFAMELIEGARIDAWFAAQRPDWRAALGLLRQVAAAVGFAHRQLVVHRDVKPANVLVGADGRPRLVDFGIAGSDTAEEADAAHRALTPEYASPEQRNGERVGPASDVFQLGRLLEDLLLTGAQVPAMPRRIRRAVDAIARQACRVDPAQRYGFGDEVALEIERVLGGRAPRAQHAGPPLRAALFLRRHAALVAVGGLALAVLIAASVHWTRRVAAERDVARSEAIQARIGADLFAYLYGGQPRADEIAAVGDLLQRAVGRYQDSPRQQLIATAAGARLLLDLRQYRDALAFIDARYSEGEDWPVERAGLLAVKAAAHRQLRDFAAAHTALDRAQALTAGQATASLRAQIHLERVDLLQHAQDGGDYADALRQKALAELAHADELDTRTLIRLLAWDAALADMKQETSHAVDTQRRVVRLSEGLYGRSSWAAWAEQRRLAGMLIRPRDPALREEARAIIARQRDAIGAVDAANLSEHMSLLNLEAFLAGNDNLTDDALRFRREAVDLLRTHRPGTFTLAAQIEAYAVDLINAGRPLEAMDAYRDSIQAHATVLGADNVLVEHQRMELAGLECAHGDVASANTQFAAVRAALRAEGSKALAGDRAMADLYWADCLNRQGRRDDALPVFREADAVARSAEQTLNGRDRRLLERLRRELGTQPTD